MFRSNDTCPLSSPGVFSPGPCRGHQSSRHLLCTPDHVGLFFRSLFPFQKPILRANREANFQHWIIVSVCCLTITSRRMNSFARGLLVVITESRTKRDLSAGHLDDDWCYRLGGLGENSFWKEIRDCEGDCVTKSAANTQLSKGFNPRVQAFINTQVNPFESVEKTWVCLIKFYPLSVTLILMNWWEGKRGGSQIVMTVEQQKTKQKGWQWYW